MKFSLRPAQAKQVRPYLKNKIKTEGLKGMAPVVEHLPTKHEAVQSLVLGSIKKKKGGGV
jgi:hypothetical protein